VLQHGFAPGNQGILNGKSKNTNNLPAIGVDNMSCSWLFSYGTDIHFTKEINFRDITCM
jgi:hypothetical protein